MADSLTILRDGDAVHRLRISHRDWMLISGPGFVEGRSFVEAFGVFEHFTVACGIPKGSVVHRDGQTLFDASSRLLEAIERDLELLRYDYSYKLGDRPRRFGGGESVSVDGRPGILSLRPKGYCSIRFTDGMVPLLIDLRRRENFVTDAGPIKLFRRTAEVHWPEVLPPLLDFLGTRLAKPLTLEHIDRAG